MYHDINYGCVYTYEIDFRYMLYIKIHDSKTLQYHYKVCKINDPSYFHYIDTTYIIGLKNLIFQSGKSGDKPNFRLSEAKKLSILITVKHYKMQVVIQNVHLIYEIIGTYKLILKLLSITINSETEIF